MAAGTGQISGGGGLSVSGAIALNGGITNGVANTSGAAFTQNVTNTNTGVTAATINAHTISLIGTANANANANTLNGLYFTNVTPIANNTFNGLNFGTGYNSLLPCKVALVEMLLAVEIVPKPEAIEPEAKAPVPVKLP